MTREDLIKRGHAAKALLENSDFILAMDTVRLDAFKGWAGSIPSQNAEREEQYYLLQAVDKLKNNLEALSSSARFEEHKAENN